MASERNPQKRRCSSVHQYVENISHKLDQLSKGISKGITAGVSKTKKFAIEKVVKAEPTKETDEMMEALAMFNTIQNTFESLLDDTITNVYESQVDESRHSLRLSEAMMSLETFDVQHDEYVYDLFEFVFTFSMNLVHNLRILRCVLPSLIGDFVGCCHWKGIN